SVEERKPDVPATAPERTLPLKTGPSAASSASPLKGEPPEVRTARPNTVRDASPPSSTPVAPPMPRTSGAPEIRQARSPGSRASSGAVPTPTMHEEPRQLGPGANQGARFTKQADDRGHFLLLESGEPVALDPGKLFVIGRDQRAGLVLRAAGVSRQHCEIDW